MIEKIGKAVKSFFRAMAEGHIISDTFDDFKIIFGIQDKLDEIEATKERIKKLKEEIKEKKEDNWSNIVNIGGTSKIIINDQVWVNGKKLEKGTPEYDRAILAGKEGIRAGRAGLDAGMKSLDRAMKNMEDIFKDF